MIEQLPRVDRDLQASLLNWQSPTPGLTQSLSRRHTLESEACMLRGSRMSLFATQLGDTSVGPGYPETAGPLQRMSMMSSVGAVKSGGGAVAAASSGGGGGGGGHLGNQHGVAALSGGPGGGSSGGGPGPRTPGLGGGGPVERTASSGGSGSGADSHHGSGSGSASQQPPRTSGSVFGAIMHQRSETRSESSSGNRVSMKALSNACSMHEGTLHALCPSITHLFHCPVLFPHLIPRSTRRGAPRV